MPGGYKNIGPNDGKKFSLDYNGRDFEKWTEDKCLEILDLLETWLLEKVPVLDNNGICTHMVDAGNVFYKEFLYQHNLYNKDLIALRFSFIRLALRWQKKHADSVHNSSHKQ